MSVNKVILVGNLGQDPEIRHTENGSSVANLSLATSKKWKSREGESKEATEWHRVVVWGPVADVIGRYTEKGSQLYIEGELKTRKWKDHNSNDRYTTEVVVSGIGGVVNILKGKSKTENQPDDDAFPQDEDPFAL